MKKLEAILQEEKVANWLQRAMMASGNTGKAFKWREDNSLSNWDDLQQDTQMMAPYLVYLPISI